VQSVAEELLSGGSCLRLVDSTEQRTDQVFVLGKQLDDGKFRFLHEIVGVEVHAGFVTVCHACGGGYPRVMACLDRQAGLSVRVLCWAREAPHRVLEPCNPARSAVLEQIMQSGPSWRSLLQERVERYRYPANVIVIP
jgi:hypothetical protein